MACQTCWSAHPPTPPLGWTTLHPSTSIIHLHPPRQDFVRPKKDLGQSDPIFTIFSSSYTYKFQISTLLICSISKKIPPSYCILTRPFQLVLQQFTCLSEKEVTKDNYIILMREIKEVTKEQNIWLTKQKLVSVSC